MNNQEKTENQRNKEENEQGWHLEKVKVVPPHPFWDSHVSGSQVPIPSLSFEVCSWYLLHPRQMPQTRRANLFSEERLWLRSLRRRPELRSGFPCKPCPESKWTVATAPNYVHIALGLWNCVWDAETQGDPRTWIKWECVRKHACVPIWVKEAKIIWEWRCPA